MNNLDPILKLIKTGQRDTAFKELSTSLKQKPRDKDAWWLMLALVEDHEKKIDCYQQILRLDPKDVVAKAHLEALRKVEMDEERIEVSDEAHPDDHPDRYPNCGGDLEIHFIGDLKDKWAVCPYCQTKIDLPDAYRRIERVSEEHGSGRKKSRVETTVIETRGDRGTDLGNLPQDIKALFNRGSWDESLDTHQEMLEKIKDGSIAFHKIESGSLWVDNVKKMPPEVLNFLRKYVAPQYTTLPDFIRALEEEGRKGTGMQFGDSSVHIVEAIPTDERIKCPKCEAVISKYDQKCQ